MIVGIDEVGRGPWAGPLVIGAVVLGDAQIEGLTDSKKLTKAQRERFNERILTEAPAVGLGWVGNDELDAIGIAASLRLACIRALKQITVPYHEIIIDGTVNFLKDTNKGPYVTTMKKADSLIASVSAASIVAKVARDDYMSSLDEAYPEYHFGRHAGYGTAAHRAALIRHGVTPHHRRSFAPIAAMLGETLPTGRMNTTTVGSTAESIAADWLVTNGYRVVERNWKTRFCEIDIIAVKNQTTYFVEVKHRRASGQGGGIAAITPQKLRQMKFAASVYLKAHALFEQDAVLAVATTTGDTPVVEDFLLLS